jgi:hypothetical protein
MVPPGDTRLVASRLPTELHGIAVPPVEKNLPGTWDKANRVAALPAQSSSMASQRAPLGALSRTLHQVTLPNLCIEAALSD